MEDLAMRVAVFVAVGFASGFLSGLFGVGGGIVRIPIFLHLLPLFGVAHALVMHVSVGTSIALVIPSAMAATSGSETSTSSFIGPGPSACWSAHWLETCCCRTAPPRS